MDLDYKSRLFTLQVMVGQSMLNQVKFFSIKYEYILYWLKFILLDEINEI